MQKVRLLALMSIVVVVAFVFTGVASAHTFEASKAGALKRVSNETQVFNLGGLIVECSTVEISNSKVPAGSFLLSLLYVKYQNCRAKFIFEFEATVSPVLTLISADLKANLEVPFVVDVLLGSCHRTVKPQNNLSFFHFKNSGTNVVVEPNITGILSVGSGGECGTGHTNKGTYTGSTVIELVGGTLGWK